MHTPFKPDDRVTIPDGNGGMEPATIICIHRTGIWHICKTDAGRIVDETPDRMILLEAEPLGNPDCCPEEYEPNPYDGTYSED